MNALKRVACIHDISGIGKCSLTAAIPIISAAGIEAAVIGKLTEGGKYMLVNGMRLPLEQPGSDALYDAKL